MNRSENEKKRGNQGFTLLELIVVITILLILAAAIGINVIRYIEKSRQEMDVYNATLIRDAICAHNYPADFHGRPVTYTDPDTGESETYKRGWVYIDRTEIRCSDPSTTVAMINAGLVHVSPQTEKMIILNEDEDTWWYPSGPDEDYIRKSNIGEYVFHNKLCVKARTTWNTYQIDVYVANSGELFLGASASNTIRTSGHAKDEATAKEFAKRVGLDGAFVTPIGEQYNGN